ncbi:MFS transporter, ACDE family, multidrug resistance protein [Desulfonispora thiosulfatigenes DSM 11270]|uniref:MFS transporter, ACDE family, multidrug resistance protein n=1 Tax=Desulfonispora thiosulfatigenes DSM 11270 TaxID=656914 RepID=A0A1W1VHE0_DESTI|nr:MFS transporter [Desulfonispora thiosulfatigenes]SMB92663.1 MFS transporter, ACDE family, multidrug resistance protein [Desulfonispora thiosulfatigenes DSM 11270]
MKAKSNIVLASLGAVPLLMVLGNSMLIPVLPQMKSSLGITQFQVSLVITLFSIPAGLAIPFAGFLSDRYSRKKIIVPSLIIYGVGGVIALLAVLFMKKPYYAIMAGRVVQGIGAAGTAPIAMALASDIFTSDNRSKALGILEAANGLGKVISPILGSLLGIISWYALFYLFPILCIPTALAVWFLVKDPTTNQKSQSLKEYTSSLTKIFKNKGLHLMSTFFSGSVALFVLFGTLFYLSDYLEKKYGLEGVKKGLVLAIPVLGSSITSFLTGILTQRKKNKYKYLVIGGLILLSLSNLMIIFFIKNLYLFVTALAIGGVGAGLVLTCINTLITSSVSTEERGMITALYGAVRFTGVAVGPPIFGILMEKSNTITFGFAGGLAILAAIVVFFFTDPKVSSEDQTKNQKKDKKEEKNRFNYKKFILDTLMLRNTLGKLLVRPSLKPNKKDESINPSNYKDNNGSDKDNANENNVDKNNINKDNVDK